MKKIFTLVLGLTLALAMFAADRKPTVTVNAPKKYEIVIDGKRYSGNYGNTISISNMFNGRHDIRVYEVKQGFFMRSKRLVASSAFQLRNSDVQINIDRFGQMQITESGFGRNWNDNDNGRGSRGHDRDNRDRRF
jgi:hypothetical protein